MKYSQIEGYHTVRSVIDGGFRPRVFGVVDALKDF